MSDCVGNDVLLAYSAFYTIALCEKRNRRRRRWWTRKIFQEGDSYGINLMNELMLEDGSGFRNFTRMSSSDFEIILQKVGPKISKLDTRYRAAISPTIRLLVTLRFLASGDSYTSLQYTFKISKQSISQIVPEVCESIISELKAYVKVRDVIALLYIFTINMEAINRNNKLAV